MATMTVGAASLQALGRFGPRALARPGGMRRDSVEAGTFEDTFFGTPSPRETDAILRAAHKALDAGRRLRRDARRDGRTLAAPEHLLASLTASAVRVLEELLTLARLNRGRVFPTYDHLAEVTGLGRVTVARSLAILDRIGFLLRRRRFKRVDGDGPGPRWAQTSNVYRLLLPPAILAYLPRRLRPAPIPDDAAQREAERRDDQRAMLERLDCRDLAKAQLGDSPLARMLARLGAAIDGREREYHPGPQTLPESLLNGTTSTRTTAIGVGNPVGTSS
jgi:hypothetical protein